MKLYCIKYIFGKYFFFFILFIDGLQVTCSIIYNLEKSPEKLHWSQKCEGTSFGTKSVKNKINQ